MSITFAPGKHDETLADCGLDFAVAVEIFGDGPVDSPDLRRDGGEIRITSVGFLRIDRVLRDAADAWE